MDPSSYQQEVIAAGQAENTAELAEAPEGTGIIEVFTVDHNRAGPQERHRRSLTLQHNQSVPPQGSVVSRISAVR